MHAIPLLLALAMNARSVDTTLRMAISPKAPVVATGDTIRLTALVRDAKDRLVPADIRWVGSGSPMEGTVDSAGLVRAGAVGTIVATAIAFVPGRQRPLRISTTVKVVPSPATRLEVIPDLDTLLVGQLVPFRGIVRSTSGDQRSDPVAWAVSDTLIASVTPDGELRGHRHGMVRLVARAGRATATRDLRVLINDVKRLELRPTRVSARTGDVLRFALSAELASGQSAHVLGRWSVAPGTAVIDDDGVFVAEQPGQYRVIAQMGTMTAEARVNVAAREVAQRADVIGRLPINMMSTEFHLHPSQPVGYLATGGLTGVGGDRLYAVDLRDPQSPRIVDSVLVDARIVNDITTTADGRLAILTREGAANRRNGIVILSLEDPLHPHQISEFSETVTGGVHSAFVSGRYVYLTDDATGSVRIIDIGDPYRPKEVGRWQTPNPHGRYVHDIEIRDGVAYVSYWNDGLIILDVGRGLKGGTPTAPQLISQLKYDLEGLYRHVEVAAGPGYLRGTHTSLLAGRYLMVADEVLPAEPIGQGVPGRGRAWGRLQVIDVSDIERPRAIAWYESGDGGTHNMAVAGDTLFLGDYQGGLKVLDISGELRGDLGRQGRLMSHVMTGDARGHVPNIPGAWGAQWRDGLIYVPDVNSGLWIIQLRPRSRPAS